MAIPGGADGVVSSSKQLEAVGISKRFGEVLALDGASFRLRPGTVHALLGENGAGKTTLMRIVYGMLQPDAGAIYINGRATRLRSPADAIRHGIGMVHQHFSLVPRMTAVENFALGGHGSYSPALEAQRLTRFSSLVGLTIDASVTADAMSTAEQQQLEIAKALGRECRILILDEPTAVLPPPQAAALLSLIRNLASAGRSVVLITHKIRDALAVADDITVLRHGRTSLSEKAPVDKETLLAAMLGTQYSELRLDTEGHDASSAEHSSAGRPLATLRGVSAEDARTRERLFDVTLEVHSGEIVGIAGLEGSGHRLLLRILAGRRQVARGSCTIPSEIGFIPEDRGRQALALEMDLRENVALHGAAARRGWIHWRRWSALARIIVRDYAVQAPSDRAAAGTLSGGNQQKLVVARELSSSPALIVAENPTRGLDVRAAQQIRQRLRDATMHGNALVLYSSDLDELTAEAGRVYVTYTGHLRECAVQRDAIGRAMLGAG